MAVERLVTGSGERVQVIYPGRENRDSGPDFVGAILAVADGEPLTGDIELHFKASDWKNHGHHHDPGYNEVILQVVWDGDVAAMLQNGKRVPTLSLCHCLKGLLEDVRHQVHLPMFPSDPCHNAGQELGDSEMGRLLDEAGEERFLVKAGCFAGRLDKALPSQVLYQGIMGALGYTKNKDQFEELACRLPLVVLEGLCRGKPPHEQVLVLKALLLGMAGLLPDVDNGQLEKVWRCLGNRETMDSSRWHLFRVRPENHPTRRLIGAAHLLARFMEEGLLEGVLRLVNESDSDMGRLESGFIVSATDDGSYAQRALIGWGRAREIVINIALPFTFAWAESNSQEKLAEQTLALYGMYPKAGENEITRELTKMLGMCVSGQVNSVRRQQGLIHLAKTFCRQRRCDECPLGRRSSSMREVSCT